MICINLLIFLIHWLYYELVIDNQPFKSGQMSGGKKDPGKLLIIPSQNDTTLLKTALQSNKKEYFK